MQSPVKIWRNQKKIQSLIGKKGKIISWTTIRVPPAGFSDQAPYPVVIIKLNNGLMITAQMVDYNEKHLVFGQEVMTVIRRVIQPNTEGIIPYGIKVKPCLPAGRPL